ncbi:tyrosine-protein phosphatase [Dyadobacter sp. CY312]|uniref:tyrosine-protein phosphatase n=1 Tax=Dyadobacter sp. CY312 TaxID=2907303 RepID=UPI001F350915|nr:tyrosine-protein phosphatase [Dyadobacter sp. CY312]MCE7040267.1 tyrosine-protein phosphatase [Dyadobacter sp. CY312]
MKFNNFRSKICNRIDSNRGIVYVGILAFLISSCSAKLSPESTKKTLREPVYVENSGKQYTLHVSNPKAVSEIQFYTNPQSKIKLPRSLSDSVFTFKNPPSRLYVDLLSGNDTLLVTNRQVDFKKIVNFRDLGGIKTMDGRTVKWGKIFRSDNLSKLKTSEFEKFNNLNIKSVIDLRTDHEIKGKEDHLPLGVKYAHMPTVKDNEGEIALLRKKVINGEISEQQAIDKTVGFYHDAGTVNLSSLPGIIGQITTSPDAVLYHCSAGKDRTGIVSALILSILNVDRATIMQEYLMSNYYRRQKTEKLLGKAKLGRIIKPKLDLKAIEVFMSVDKAFLNAFFEVVDKEYGGTDTFVQNQLGIGKEERQRIISRLTY